MTTLAILAGDEIISWHPCWASTRVLDAVPAGGVTLEQVRDASVDVLPDADACWLLCQWGARAGFEGRRAVVAWAADQAERVLHLVRESGQDVCRAAIAAARAWVADPTPDRAVRADAAAYAAYDAAADAYAYAADAAGRAAYAASAAYANAAATLAAAAGRTARAAYSGDSGAARRDLADRLIELRRVTP